MSNVFIALVLLAILSGVYYLVRAIMALVKKEPAGVYGKKMVAAIAAVIIFAAGSVMTQTPEQKAEIQARKEARAKEEADAKLAEQKSAEEKLLAEQKALEEKRLEEERKAQAAKLEEERKAQNAHDLMIQEITTGWTMATTDADNDKTNPQKAATIIMKYPDYVHNAPANWIDGEDALKKTWSYYGKVVNMSGRIYSINQLPPNSSDAKAFGGQCYHAMLAISEGYDPITVSMHIIGDSSNIAEDSIVNVKGYIFGQARLVNRLGGSSRGLAFIGFNE